MPARRTLLVVGPEGCWESLAARFTLICKQTPQPFVPGIKYSNTQACGETDTSHSTITTGSTVKFGTAGYGFGYG